ncbi:hypothetical protein [Jiella pelagia]|uniref:Tetratricopeptide repeat-containing protein n=1 Tax=Jiella pelagia TaxID=2986949 RepID=A0ABY7C559_9HYPH|nr:hypothetical protein [Jiella pelagia]WAP70727.1 hypothetical protein OH818_12335 [Jiella pelagia]
MSETRHAVLPAAAELPDAIAAIEAALKSGDTAASGATIAEARARWPKELRLVLFEGAHLAVSGQTAAAEACFRGAMASHPSNPWPAIRLLELLLAGRRTNEAASLFAATVWPGPAPTQTRLPFLSRITSAIGDLAERRRFLDTLMRDTPEDRFVLAKRAALSIRQRDRAEAEALLDRALALGPLPDDAQVLALEIMITATRFEEALALAKDLRARLPDRADFVRRAIQAAHFLGREEEMVALLDEALERWPGDWLMVFRYNRCTVPMADDRRLFARLAAHRPSMDANERWLFQYVVACLRHGRTAEAMATLALVQDTGPAGSMAAPLRAALARLPAEAWRSTRGVVNDPAQQVQVVTRPDARATLLLLAGVQGGLGYLPMDHTDALMARLPVNVVYLRDLDHRGFTGGMRGLGPGPEDMIAGLRRITEPFGLPVVTFGSSIGGVAAIRTALDLGAHAAISFAGPIHLGAMTQEEEDRPGEGARSTIFGQFAAADLSLVERVRQQPDVRVYQCYGADFAPDVADAELLRGLPNAVLIPVPGCADHFAIEHMIADGSFFAIIERAIAAGPARP